MHRCERPAVKDGYCTRHHPSYLSPKEKKALAKFDATRPTPVAPVSPDATGKCGELETVETQMRCLLTTGNHQWRNPVSPSELSAVKENGKDAIGIPYELRDLVTRSQAVELLAAKDKLIAQLRAADASKFDINLALNSRIDDLLAKLAEAQRG